MDVNLASLNGTNGFVVNGIDGGDRLGHSVSSAGDINGDGFDDLIIGAYDAQVNGELYSGESYVIFGSGAGFPATVDLSTLNGTNGFLLTGIDGFARTGFAVSDAGDINGDGFDDLIIGAYLAEVDGEGFAGQSYVVFGASGGFAPAIDLTQLNGTDGFAVSGGDGNDWAGYSVSSAGDVNGDGFDDILIGARQDSPNGQDQAGGGYVVFGTNTGFNPNLDLSSLDGTDGFVLNGINAYDYAGTSVSSAGDINGDGFDDIIVGAPAGDPGGRDGAGESFVVFGSNAGFPASIEASALNGANGFVINGIALNDNSGTSVSGGGDINGDGFDDLIIGAPGADPNGQGDAGQSYVVFGTNTGFPAAFELSSLNGTNGFVINGINSVDFAGASVSTAGDVNGDGFDDLIIGALRGDPNGQIEAGESYVLYGSNSGFPAVVNLSTLQDDQGFVINGASAGDYAGTSVSAAGDVNGDGFDDLIVGAYSASPGGRVVAGASYVVFGVSTAPTPIDGDAGANILTGGTGDDTLNGLGGDDSLYGFDGNDLLSGGADNDFVAGGTGNDTLNGDGGDDQLWSEGGNDSLNGGAGIDLLVGGDGTDTLDGGADADQLWGQNGNDLFNGGAGDDFLVGEFGNDTLNGDDGNDQLWSGSDNDLLDGGLGEDLLVAGDGDDTLNGGEGDDELWGEAGNDLLNGGLGVDLLIGADGGDTLNGDAGDDQLWSQVGDDLLFGGDGIDLLVAGDGDDTLNGDAGDDQLWAEEGNDVLNGGAGQDFLLGANGNDTLNGGDGNDQLWSQADNDSLDGGLGADLLVGGAGNDTLNGGAGDDLLYGNTGNDLFVIVDGTGVDAIADFTSGEDQIDLSAYQGIQNFNDVLARGEEVDGSTFINLDDGSNILTLIGVTEDQLNEADFIIG